MVMITLLGFSVDGAAGEEHGAPSADEILKRYADALAEDPITEASLSEIALAMMEARHPEQAAEYAQLLLDLDERNADGHFVLGWVAQERGNSDEALLHYLRAEELGDSRPALHFNVGVLRYAQGFYEMAIDRAQRAIDELSNFTMAWQLKGEALFALERYDAAEMVFTGVTALEGRNPMGFVYRGLTRLRTGKHKQSIVDFDRAIALDPENPWPYLYRADGQLGLGRPYRALDDLELARELEAPEVEILIREASAFEMSDRPRTAELQLNRALELDPENPWLWSQRAELLDRLGRRRAAVEDYRRAIELAPDWPDPYNAMGYLLNRMGQYRKAIPVLERALDLVPDWTYPLNNLGNSYAAIGRVDASVALFRRALRTDPTYLFAAYNLGRVLYNERADVEGALEALTQALQIDPHYIPALELRAEINFEGGISNRLARTDIDRVLDIDPERTRALRMRAEIDFAEERYWDAAAGLRFLLDLEPEDTEARTLLADTLLHLGLMSEVSGLVPNDERVARVANQVQPVFSGKVVGHDEPSALRVVLSRLHGREVVSLDVDQEGTFEIPLMDLPPRDFAENWFSDAVGRQFVIAVHGAEYERHVYGRDLARFHVIRLSQ
jgi:tetratricopeptide (TPR) repeat protein